MPNLSIGTCNESCKLIDTREINQNHESLDPALNSLDEWVSNAPVGEDRTMVANLIRDAIEKQSYSLEIYDKNITCLPDVLPADLKELKFLCCDKLQTLPKNMPDQLESLVIRGCSDLKNLPDSLPSQLRELEITSSGIIGFPGTWPDNLSSLRLASLNKLAPILNKLPGNLRYLSIDMCSMCKLPQSLPQNLQSISINQCDIREIPENLPPNLINLDITKCAYLTKGPKFLPHTLETVRFIPSDSNPRIPFSPEDWPAKLKELVIGEEVTLNEKIRNCKNLIIKVNNMEVKIVFAFKPGEDIVYGLSEFISPEVKNIRRILGLSARDITNQANITNAVWTNARSREYSDDETITRRLSDSARAIEFKKFLINHHKYNVANRQPEVAVARDGECVNWNRTSKAGLEFQTKVRGGDVHFCVDGLMDNISDIAEKKPRKGTSITASELRWLYRHRNDEDVRKNVHFYIHGDPIAFDDVFSDPNWKSYAPKSQVL